MYPKLIETLIERLTKLPGIGRRSAERIVYWMLAQDAINVKALADSIQQLKEGLRFCKLCNHLTETELCLVCADSNRDHKTICIVESPKDLLAIERTGSYRGIYYVLLGNISPSEGRGPDDLNTGKLITRIKDEGITEIVIATDPDAEGEIIFIQRIKKFRSQNQPHWPWHPRRFCR